MLLEFNDLIVNTDNVFFYSKYSSQGKSYNIRFVSVNRDTVDFIFQDQKSCDFCYQRIKQLMTCVTFKDILSTEDVIKPVEIITKPVDINITNEKF